MLVLFKLLLNSSSYPLPIHINPRNVEQEFSQGHLISLSSSAYMHGSFLKIKKDVLSDGPCWCITWLEEIYECLYKKKNVVYALVTSDPACWRNCQRKLRQCKISDWASVLLNPSVENGARGFPSYWSCSIPPHSSPFHSVLPFAHHTQLLKLLRSSFQHLTKIKIILFSFSLLQNLVSGSIRYIVPPHIYFFIFFKKVHSF